MRSITVLALCVVFCGFGCDDESKIATQPEPGVIAPALKSVSVFHSVQNGRSASAYFFEELTGGFLDVWESRAGRERGADLYYFIERADPDSEVCEEECFCDPWPGDGGGPLPPPPPIGGTGSGGGPAGAGGAGGSGPPDAGGGCPPGCFYDSWCYYTRYSFEDGYGSIDPADFRATPNRATLRTSVTSGEDFTVYRCTFDQDAFTQECAEVTETVLIDASWMRDGQSTYFQSGIYRDTYGDMTYQSQGTWRGSSANAEGQIGDFAFDTEDASISSSHDANVMREVFRD